MLIPLSEERREEVIELLIKFHSESSYYNDEPLNMQKVQELYSACLYSADCFGILAVNAEDQIVGVMAGCITKAAFSDFKLAEDLSIYVLPEYRKKAGISVRLVDAYITWARSKGVRDKHIRVSVSAGIDNQGACHFLKRLGFKEFAHTYVYEGIN